MSTEAAIKIFDPRTVNLEGCRGRGKIHWDDIAAILAKLARENPVGYQLLMVRFRDDKTQEKALRGNVTIWAERYRVKHHIPDDYPVIAACLAALDMMLHRPLTTQIRGLQHLHRLHGGYALRESLRRKKLKKMLTHELKKDYPDKWKMDHIATQIEHARVNIDRWVKAHATVSTLCPRCRGTGVVSLPSFQMCPECNGAKHFAPTDSEIRRHISNGAWGISIVNTCLPAMDECKFWLAESVGVTTNRLNELFEMNAEEPV